MPAYKYFTKDGKTKWYANFYYEDWLGKRQHKCKRGFSTKKDAVEWERGLSGTRRKGSRYPVFCSDQELYARLQLPAEADHFGKQAVSDRHETAAIL